MIDFNKPVQTRDGRKVRILCTDGPDESRPVAGFTEGYQHPMTWRLNGIFSTDGDSGPSDLINAPERVERWFNLYRGVAGMAFDSRKESIEASSPWPPHMLALVKVTFEDGKPVAVALEDCK